MFFVTVRRLSELYSAKWHRINPIWQNIDEPFIVHYNALYPIMYVLMYIMTTNCAIKGTLLIIGLYNPQDLYLKYEYRTETKLNEFCTKLKQYAKSAKCKLKCA
jgi:hypothetical protein